MSKRKADLIISGDWVKELRALPVQLAKEGSLILVNSANNAALQIINTYPKHTGNLAGGVEVTTYSTKLFTRATVVNRAKLAFIYENGTEARHYVTEAGVKHETGRMPPAHVFDPIVRRWQRKAEARIAALFAKWGFKVTNAAA